MIGGISIQSKILVLGALGFNQLFVYIFSCLFTLSAVCLLFEFSCKNIDFCKVFCQNFVFKRLIFTLLFTFVSCLFTFCQLFVYFLNFQAKTLKNHDFFAKILSLNSWFSTLCLIFLFIFSAVCLHFFQLFVCFFKNLNFRAKT